MNMMQKSVVILVNYKGYQDTAECIDSIKKSSIMCDIVVIDNASGKNDAELLSQRSDCYVIASKENKGFAGGNNIGIKYALDCGYSKIVLLNNDTIVKFDMLQKLLEQVDENTICTPCMYYYDNDRVVWYGGGHINRLTGRAIHEHMDKTDAGENKLCTFATGCCIAMSSETVKRIGYLDESYFMYCEDTEFCLRALKNGVQIKYISTAKLWHKVSRSTGGEFSDFSVYYMTRNRLKYLEDYREYFGHIPFWFTLISRYIKCFLLMLKKNPQYLVYLKAIADYKKKRYGSVKSFA